MPTNISSPYNRIPSPSVTSLITLSPQETSHEGHSPYNPLNKFNPSQVALLRERIIQKILMAELMAMLMPEDKQASAGTEAGAGDETVTSGAGGQQKASYIKSQFRRLLAWKPSQRFHKLRGFRREKYKKMA